ncbi:interferon-related developmental regulator 1 [Chelonus insularis]|uniref:interferon-related developmental regulator 1 n=1 Tax=Chelonus insularis TaxID=460826 RepID=UPI00158C56AA|nr:interferon-related developmental regulator 1 [Chelonus insularis]
MPGKRGRKGKSGQHGKRAEVMSDDDLSTNDAASVTSGQSDNKSLAIDDVNDNNEIDEISQQEVFEEKLKEAIDGLSQKSAKGRTFCFNGIEKMFSLKYVPDFVEDRKMTITDCVERGLKKGKNDEKCVAARLSTLLCVQLGAFESAEIVCKDLKSILMLIANDNTVSTQVRAECCWALSMNHFLSGNDAADTVVNVQLLSNIFAGSYLKGNGAAAAVSVELGTLHAAALSAWTLLLTIMTPSDIYNLLASSRINNFMPSLDRLRQLLESPHLDVRMSAGEALAVIFELGREYSEDYEHDWAADELVDVLKELATDSNKSRAKKDRKQQRASFRDILRYIEEDIVPEMQIRFGKETLYLEGWCPRIQYNACCRILGSGINIHLAENLLLRDIFHLGNTVPVTAFQKTSKLERTLMNAAAFKARTILRNKTRDKRSVAMSQ